METAGNIFLSLLIEIRNFFFDFIFRPYEIGRSLVVGKEERHDPPPPGLLGGGGMGTGTLSYHLIISVNAGNGRGDVKVAKWFYDLVATGDALVIRYRVGRFTVDIQAKLAN
ncbi:MAG: hypothetical protein AAB358_03500 [Patescibacteria group bacterium]